MTSLFNQGRKTKCTRKEKKRDIDVITNGISDENFKFHFNIFLISNQCFQSSTDKVFAIMDVDEDVGEVLSAAIQPLSTITMSTQIKTSTGAANGSPSLRRSMRLRRISGESSSTAADRLLHRTSTGGIGSTPTQTARQSAVSKRSISSSTSTNRRTVPLAVVDDLVGGRANDAGNCSNQSIISPTDQLASSVVDVSSDDDTGNNNLNARSYSTRSIVLENFVEEENGFRCKFCKEVSKIVNATRWCGKMLWQLHKIVNDV